jgi:hypothetical protein
MPGPATPYGFLTYDQAIDALLLRLNSTGTDFWERGEAALYILEGMRVWNCLTQTYVQDWTTNYDAAASTWQSTGNSSNPLVGSNPTSPRTQFITSNYIFQSCQFHLLEPVTGGTWTGTPQYSINDLAQAFQRRRDYVLQQTACNVGPIDPIPVPILSNRVYLPDTVLDIRRLRFLPTADGLGEPATLYREDGLSTEYFENDFTVAEIGTAPFAYDLISGPPLAVTLDVPANVPNNLDILAMISGGTVAPPTGSPILIPNDWYWVIKFGVLSDLFRMESESQDLERADYCEKRFQEGIELMKSMPWLLQARVNNFPVDTPSVSEMDDFNYEWQSNPDADLCIVRGGIDLFALSPNPALGQVGYGEGGYGDGGYGGTGSGVISVTMSLVANVPIPALDGFLQISRDTLDYILDYAQHMACLKMGGFEFAESTRTLYKNFIAAAVNTNSRLGLSGIFESTLRPVGDSKQNFIQPRFELQQK